MRFTVTIDDALETALDDECRAAGVSRGQLTSIALSFYLNGLRSMRESLPIRNSVKTPSPGLVQSAPNAGAICTTPAPFDRNSFINKHVRATDDDVCRSLIEELADLSASTPSDEDLLMLTVQKKAELQRVLGKRRLQLAQNQ